MAREQRSVRWRVRPAAAAARLSLLVLLIEPGGSGPASALQDDPACTLEAPAERPGGALVDPSGAIRPLEDDRIVEDAVVAELLAWIGAHTAYDVSASLAEPPSIGFCRTGEVIVYEGENLLVDPDLGAAYDKDRRHIYLAQPWDAAVVEDIGTLLHELIHDVQYRNRDWPCWQKTEWEAYKLQAAWLAERGVNADFNWALILLLSRCSQNHHP